MIVSTQIFPPIQIVLLVVVDTTTLLIVSSAKTDRTPPFNKHCYYKYVVLGVNKL